MNPELLIQQQSMEYNTDRPQLKIPEYGRNVHNMVNYCMTIEDREKRNKVAQSIIDVIGNLNPQIRDVADFKHKLWDHLFIMSNFKLDVDSPYPIPTPETFTEKPESINYPEKSNKFRHYGGIIRRMIHYAVQLEEGPLKEGLVQSIANQMKKSYLLWNKDTVDDAVILQELMEISGGKLQVKGVELSSANQWRAHQPNQKQHSNNYRNKNRNKNRKKFKKN
jgi:hypothetical protein